MKLFVLSLVAASIAVGGSALAQTRANSGMTPFKPGTVGTPVAPYVPASTAPRVMTSAQLASYQRRTINGQQQALVNGKWMSLVAQGGGNWTLVAQGGGN